jgi:hypothetical protein
VRYFSAFSFACVSLAFSVVADAANISSTWVNNNLNEDWLAPANWSAGVPNNGGGNTYNATIYSWVRVNSPITIDNLNSLPGARLLVHNTSMTVLDGSVFGLGERRPTILMEGFENPSSLSLGNVAQFADGTVDNVSLIAESNNGSATISWNNASIQKVGLNASIQLTGVGAALLNASDSSNPLASLSENRGTVSIANGSSLTLASLRNLGNAETGGLFGVSNGTTLDIIGDVESTGTFGATASTVRIGGSLFGGGSLGLGGATQGTVDIGGSLIVKSLKIAGVSSLTVDGNTELTGRASVVGADARMDIGGNYLSKSYQSGGTIYGSSLEIKQSASARVRGDFLNDGYLSILAAYDPSNILLLTQHSTLVVDGDMTGAGTIDLTSYVRGNDYTMTASLVIGGDWDQTSTVNITAGADPGRTSTASITVKGHLTQLDANGVLHAGRFDLISNGETIAQLRLGDSVIRELERDVMISLTGAKSSIINSTSQASVLTGLRENRGQLYLKDGATIQTNVDFYNHRLNSSPGSLEVTQGSKLLVGGNFLSDGNLTLETGADTGAVTSLISVGGNLTNKGTFSVSSSAISGVAKSGVEVAGNVGGTSPIQLTASATLGGEARSYLKASSFGTGSGDTIDGVSLQLTSSGAGQGIAEVLIDGPKIRNIGPSAVISLTGANSRFTQVGTMENALVVERIYGTLSFLNLATYTSPGAISVLKDPSSSIAGKLNIQNGGKFTASTTLENRGTINLTPRLLNGGMASTLSVVGDMNNYATVNLRGGAVTTGIPLGSLLSVNGRLTNAGTISIAPQTPTNATPLASAKLLASGGVTNSGVIDVQGRDAVFESTSVLENLSSGYIIIRDAGSLVAASEVLNSGDLALESSNSFSTSATNITTQSNIAGRLENLGTISITSRVTNSFATSKGRSALTVSSLSNPGTISLTASASKTGQTGNAVLTVTNSFQQLQAGVLTAGTLSVAAAVAGASSEVYIPGTISRIGSAASINLNGSNAHIRQTSDQSDALATLRDIDGRFSLTSRSFSPSGDINVGTQGTLNLGSGANFQMGAGKLFESDGLLQMNAGSIFGAIEDVVFGDSSLLKYVFTIGTGNTLAIGDLTSAGEVVLAGNLSLNFSSIAVFSPLPTTQFTLLRGGLVSGEFANVADGEFINVLWNGNIAGQFQLDYQSDRVVLTNFQSVPEPSMMVLLALSGLILGAGYKTRIARAKRP